MTIAIIASTSFDFCNAVVSDSASVGGVGGEVATGEACKAPVTKVTEPGEEIVKRLHAKMKVSVLFEYYSCDMVYSSNSAIVRSLTEPHIFIKVGFREMEIKFVRNKTSTTDVNGALEKRGLMDFAMWATDCLPHAGLEIFEQAWFIIKPNRSSSSPTVMTLPHNIPSSLYTTIMHARSEPLTLTTIPEEMLFEIALQLHPEDLHRLARTSKANHSRLSSPLKLALEREQKKEARLGIIQQISRIPDSKLLSIALNNRQYETVTWLLTRVDPTACVYAVCSACENGDLEMLKVLRKSIPVSCWGDGLDSVLASAVKSNDLEIVRFVLNQREVNVDVNKGEGGDTQMKDKRHQIIYPQPAAPDVFRVRIARVSIKTEIINFLEKYGYIFNTDSEAIADAIHGDHADLVIHFINKLRIEETTTKAPPNHIVKLEELAHLSEWTKTFGPKVIKALFKRNMMSMYEPGELRKHLKSAIKHACTRPSKKDVDKVEVLMDTGMVELASWEVRDLLETSRMHSDIGPILIRRGIVDTYFTEWFLIGSAKYPFDCFFKVLNDGGFLSTGWDVTLCYRNAIYACQVETVNYLRQNHLSRVNEKELVFRMEPAKANFLGDDAELFFNLFTKAAEMRYMIKNDLESASTNYIQIDRTGNTITGSPTATVFQFNASKSTRDLPHLIHPSVITFIIQHFSPIKVMDLTTVLQAITQFARYKPQGPYDVINRWGSAEILEHFWPLAGNGWKKRAFKFVCSIGYLRLIKKLVQWDGKLLLLDSGDELGKILKDAEEKEYFEVADFLVEARRRLMKSRAVPARDIVIADGGS
ncbi:hypothetical protein HDU76_003066 [Blyttiomyces sp. JEL0837]|nr:hypothetical protein HDU76_003066 [Blyttiomyces sp. JEL0837]